jgi:hypothetical protein
MYNKRAIILTVGLIIVVALTTFTPSVWAWLAEAPENHRAPLSPLFQSSINPPSVIAGTVFDDLDGDGEQDVGESGIPDITVELLQDGSVIVTAATDDNGDYIFTRGLAGDYTVRETDPPGYASTTPNEVDVSITVPGQTVAGVDFGDWGIGAIEGTVFDDLNGNAMQDEGEMGIDGVVITLLQDGATVDTTATAADGVYQFTSLWLGDYTVRETDPPGYASTTPNEVPVSLATPGQMETVDFGDRGIGAVEGTVFDDRNGNAVLDEGEMGIGGVVITLLQDGAIIDTTATAADGVYQFTSVWLGDYTVRETDPPGYVSTTPNEVNVSITAPGQTVAGVDFGDRGIGMIEGTVFDDLNGNAVQDEGEMGIGSVMVTLLQDGSTISTTATTDDGAYQFPSLHLGDYTVRETDPPGYASTTPNEVDVSLSTPGQTETADFGDRGVGEIKGLVFDDRDGDAVQDEGEMGIGGVIITLLQDGSTVDTTTTASDGSYEFAAVWLGDYTVRETDPPGYVSTTPNEVDVSITAPGQAVAGVDFGDRGIGAIEGTVFDDRNGNWEQDEGEPGIGGVIITLLQDGSTVDTATTAADGVYQFTSLYLGDYTVRETDLANYVSVTPNEADISLDAPGQVEMTSTVMVSETLVSQASGAWRSRWWVKTRRGPPPPLATVHTSSPPYRRETTPCRRLTPRALTAPLPIR